jgi:N-carbamoyl-L-amino-acid hydrolase
MEDRRDALLAAGHLIVALRRLSDEAEGTLYTSVGRMEIEPNSPNVVPGRATLWVELRSVDRAVLDTAAVVLDRMIAEAAAAAGVAGAIVGLEVRQPGRFDDRILALAGAAADALGYPTMPLDTIAAHDALPMASVCPSAVIVTPSCGGLCHNEAEFTAPEDLEAGANVLLSMLWTLCRRPAGALWA